MVEVAEPLACREKSCSTSDLDVETDLTKYDVRTRAIGAL